MRANSRQKKSMCFDTREMFLFELGVRYFLLYSMNFNCGVNHIHYILFAQPKVNIILRSGL